MAGPALSFVAALAIHGAGLLTTALVRRPPHPARSASRTGASSRSLLSAALAFHGSGLLTTALVR